MPLVRVCADETAVAAAAAERFTSQVEAAIAARGTALVCLTGGETPERLYELLADAQRPWRGRIDWGAVHFFWGDERHVPPDHPDSNFGMAQRALLQHVPVSAEQVHRMRGELQDAGAAAADYDDTMRCGFALARRDDLTFDLMLLGLGPDAHIASIFPGSPLLDRTAAAAGEDRAAAVWAPHLDAWRITLTPRALLDARAIVVVVAGVRKADAVQAALDAPLDVPRWPAQLVRQADPRVEWIIDVAAAGARSRGATPS